MPIAVHVVSEQDYRRLARAGEEEIRATTTHSRSDAVAAAGRHVAER